MVKIDTSKLEAKCKQLQKKFNINMITILKEAAMYFTQAIIKVTSKTHYKKRPVLPWKKKGQIEPSVFIVFFRRMINGQDVKSQKSFGKKKDYRKLLTIKNRGLNKELWNQAFSRIGNPVNVNGSTSEAKNKAKQFSNGKIFDNFFSKPMIKLSIETMQKKSWVNGKVNYALSKAKNRLKNGIQALALKGVK